MRVKKIRGHRIRWKAIDRWVVGEKEINVQQRERYYSKIRVHPWTGISIENSTVPEPNGATKAKILTARIEIYNDRKLHLDTLGQRYYLKIWLMELRFSNSQVVCAIGECLDNFHETFFKPEATKKLNAKNYGKLKKSRWII